MSLIVRCAVRASKTGGDLSESSMATRLAMLRWLLAALQVNDKVVLEAVGRVEIAIP